MNQIIHIVVKVVPPGHPCDRGRVDEDDIVFVLDNHLDRK